VILNLLALAATAVVAAFGAVQGLYRALMTLTACVLAAVLAFGLFGPIAGVFFPVDNPKSVWYYAADVFCLWTLLAAGFLALRTLGEKLLPVDPSFPWYLNRPGGVVFGVLTGYLGTGLCLLLVQMLPTSPDLLGYETFKYLRAPSATEDDDVRPDEPLWLAWDRGALAFFDYLSSLPLGSEEASLLHRYGDVCPPPERRGDAYEPVLDADDFLYYHWYRRWQYIQWSTGWAMRPIPLTSTVAQEGPGLALDPGQTGILADMNVRIIRVDRVPLLETFPQERPGSDEEFLLVGVRFRPERSLPHRFDSAQLVLLESLRPKGGIMNPRILGRARARAAGAPPQPVADCATPAPVVPRNLRFEDAPKKTDLAFLADGAAFTFTKTGEFETRSFIFVVPKNEPTDQMRLNVLPGTHAAVPAAWVPAAPSPPAAKPAATKSPPSATPAPASKAPGAPATRPAQPNPDK